jgi:deoxyribodipyrimidine photo-lyase
MMTFPVAYDLILERIGSIDPVEYARSRNFLSGAVTGLSPYISRGVISTRQVLESLVSRNYKLYDCEILVKELAWRDFFQRVLQERPDLIVSDIKNPQYALRSDELPAAIVNASTGIEAIDRGIDDFYETGYMHNHMRMYVASITCNMAACSWKNAGRWMYYHLLDADPASNFCSWQWVCASFSSKRYLANQENINRFCNTQQQKSFLDISYEELETMEVPGILKETLLPQMKTPLPKTGKPLIDPSRPLLIYNFFSLDPRWHTGEDCNRVLLLEPSLFEKLPVSDKVIDFIMGLAGGIKDLQIFTGEFHELANGVDREMIFYREHPFNRHYSGNSEERHWMFPEVKGYFPSFSAYWKKCVPFLKQYFR